VDDGMGRKPMDKAEACKKFESMIHYLSRKIFPFDINAAVVSREDLVGAGYLGLLKACDSYDKEYGVKFETYAYHKIRGFMLDELRKMDSCSRKQRKEEKAIREAERKLAIKLDRKPTIEEIAEYTDIDIVTVSLLQESFGFSYDIDGRSENGNKFEEYIEDPSLNTELTRLELVGKNQGVYDVIDGLSEREQMVLYYYYYEAMTNDAVGERLGITGSAASNFRIKTLEKVRKKVYARRELAKFAPPKAEFSGQG